eukprot:bmy_19539T0
MLKKPKFELGKLWSFMVKGCDASLFTSHSLGSKICGELLVLVSKCPEGALSTDPIRGEHSWELTEVGGALGAFATIWPVT